MVTNTGRTKILQTKEKVLRLQSINKQLILEYRNFEELKNQRKLFRSTNEDRERYRKSYNDYSKYMRNQKFIENNFASLSTEIDLNESNHSTVILPSVNHATKTTPVEASTLQPLPVSLIDTNNTQSLGCIHMEDVENTEATTNNESTSTTFVENTEATTNNESTSNTLQENILREDIIM